MVLAPNDYLFPPKLRLYWFFHSWVILHCVLGILDIIGPGAYWNLGDDAGIFVLAGNWPGWVQATSFDHTSGCEATFGSDKGILKGWKLESHCQFSGSLNSELLL